MRWKDNWINAYDYILNQLFKYNYSNIDHLHILKLKIWVLDSDILKEENLVDNNYENSLNHKEILENELVFLDKYIRTKDKKLVKDEENFHSFVRNRKVNQRDFISRKNPDTGKRYEKWEQDYMSRPTTITDIQFATLYTQYKIKEKNNELQNAFDITSKLANIIIDNRKYQQENAILLYIEPPIQEQNIKNAAIKEKQTEDVHFVLEMNRAHEEIISIIKELKPENPEEILGLNNGEGFEENEKPLTKKIYNKSNILQINQQDEQIELQDEFKSTASKYQIKVKYLSSTIVSVRIILKEEIPGGGLFFYIYDNNEWVRSGNIWSSGTNEYGISISDKTTHIKVSEEIITHTKAIAKIDRTGAETESELSIYTEFSFSCTYIPENILDILFIGGYPEGAKFELYVDNKWVWHTASIVLKSNNGKIIGVVISNIPPNSTKLKLIKDNVELIVDIDKSGKPSQSDSVIIEDSKNNDTGSTDSEFSSTATDFSINIKYTNPNIVTVEVVYRVENPDILLFFYYYENNNWIKVEGFTSTGSNKFTFTITDNTTYIKLLDSKSNKYAIAKVNRTGEGTSSSDNTSEISGDIVICNFPTMRINVAENKNDPSHKGIIIEQLGEGGYRFKTKSTEDFITDYDLPAPDLGKYINEVDPFLDGEVEWTFDDWLYAYYFTETKKTSSSESDNSVPSVSVESTIYLRPLNINKDSFTPEQKQRFNELNKRWKNLNELRERQLANVGIRVQLESMFNATVPYMKDQMIKVFNDRKEEKINITNILKDFCLFGEFK